MIWSATPCLADDREAVIAALVALAQQTRLELVRLLMASVPDGLTAGEIAARLNVPPASLSFHFRQLVSAGLLKPCRRSRFIYYTVDQMRLAAVLACLGNLCHGAEPQLASFSPKPTADSLAAIRQETSSEPFVHPVP